MKIEALCEWARTETRDGASLREDPVVRSTLARLVAKLEVARMLQRKVISEALKERIPTVLSAMYKLFQAELGQQVANAALDLMGASGQLKPGVEGAPIGGRFERSYRYTVVDTVGGGTSEIQKNIISRRGLGLPYLSWA